MSKLKILYMSCHSVLEADEVSLFHELGFEIFSPGAFVCPENPGDDSLRPGIPGLVYDPDILEQYHKIGATHPGEDAKGYLTKEFVDNFDIVYVMHFPDWITRNWEAIKHKRVIWRTIGQSVATTENVIRPYREKGLEIVRYSPMEAYIPGFCGQDGLIRFYKDPKEFCDWNGQWKQVISFAQSMKQRDTACNFSFFEEVTRPFPRRLFGTESEAVGDWGVGKVSFDQLKQEMRDNRVYFYTGTHPASYTLNFIEALMTGIPMVAIGSKHGNADYYYGHHLYEVPYLLENKQEAVVSDDPRELQSCIKQLLEDDKLAAALGHNGRLAAIKHFNKDMIGAAWKKYLEEGP
jgi:hypothetical protein